MHFIRSVSAVNISVAPPVGNDAELGTSALEFAVTAGRVAINLIAAIITIKFSVTT